jgi:photosystem II stability/assembly factor-like uncharacterized protein
VSGALAADHDGALAFLVLVADRGDSRAFATVDRGVSWQPLHTGLSGAVEGVAVRGIPATSVAAWSSAGLFMSRDGGRAFASMATPLGGEGVVRIAFASADPMVLYAIVRAGGKAVLAATKDGGATWRALGAVPFEPTELLVGREADTLCVFGEGHVARSSDGGASFMVVRSANGQVRAVLAHPGGSLYFSDDYDVLASDDEGVTWTRVAHESAASLAPDLAHEGAVCAFQLHRQFRLTPR